MKIGVVILAGGDGSRIGGDKPQRVLGGRSLLDRMIARARGWSDVMAVSLRRTGQFPVPEGVSTIPDGAGEGPLAGLEAAFSWMHAQRQDAMLLLPCDTPFVPENLVERLSAALSSGHRVALARSGGRLHPACSLWKEDVRHELAGYRATGRSSLQGFARHAGFAMVAWETTPHDPFFNINSPEDLAVAEARYGEAR